MSDRQNLNGETRCLAHFIVFGSSLYRFTVHLDFVSCGTTCKMGAGRLFTPSLYHLQLLSLPSVFFCRAPIKYIWYGMLLPTQLQITVAPSFLKLKFTSFEFSVLEEVRTSSHSDMLQVSSGLSLVSICQAKPLTWSNALATLCRHRTVKSSKTAADWWQL